jgi:hypothetical protein
MLSSVLCASVSVVPKCSVVLSTCCPVLHPCSVPVPQVPSALRSSAHVPVASGPSVPESQCPGPPAQAAIAQVQVPGSSVQTSVPRQLMLRSSVPCPNAQPPVLRSPVLRSRASGPNASVPVPRSHAKVHAQVLVLRGPSAQVPVLSGPSAHVLPSPSARAMPRSRAQVPGPQWLSAQSPGQARACAPVPARSQCSVAPSGPVLLS